MPRLSRSTLLRPLGWLAVAALVTWPLILHPFTRLLGDPRIDVWNHAWGYWWVAHALSQGELPWRTALVGGPAGGVLYFIDSPGAFLAAPITLALGPAVAWNLVLLVRVALAGFFAQALARRLTGEGIHSWLAGVAYASAPFLLAELGNGISEVCATWWVAAGLWALAGALRSEKPRDHLLLGAILGGTAVASFYYGLALGLIVALGYLAVLRRPGRLVGGILAAGVAAAMALPVWVVFKASLRDPGALIRRSSSLDAALLAHNAVDPREYIAPGAFHSVDLTAVYGEPFVHTAYLRWSLLLLALLALWRRPALRPWGAAAGASLIIGLGSYLWWGDAFLAPGGWKLSLPFGWLRALLPEVAITHPVRLGLPAQALVAALAAGGLGVLLERVEARLHAAAVGLAAALVFAEAAFGSAATWPVPTSDATVPSLYADAPEGMVLDLPAEVGTGMATSRYFWFQTVHGRPIPYTPDARLGSAADTLLFRAFMRPGPPVKGQPGERPSTPSAEVLAHLRRTYGLVVLHRDLAREAGLEGAYEAALIPVLGAPTEEGEALVWRVGP